jgi:hypothetical protein
MTVYHANVVQTAVVGSPYFAKWQVSSIDKWSVATDGTMLSYNNSDATNTNYDRAFFRHSGNVLQIGQEAGGTGTARPILISTAADGITLKSGTNAQLNLASGGVRTGSGYSFGWSSVAGADGGSWDTYFERASTAKVKINGGAGSLWTGSVQLGHVAKTANYTLTNFDTYIAANAATASFTLTLPTAVGIAGQSFTVNKVNAANTVTIATTSSQTINGASTIALTQQWDTVTIVSDGANWLNTNKRPVMVSDTAPTTAQNGDLWWDSSLALLNVYYNDGTSSQWVSIFSSYGGALGLANLVNVVTVNSNYTILPQDDTIIANGTLTLQLPAGTNGRKYNIKNINTGTVTILPNGAETIDGYANAVINSMNTAMGLTFADGRWLIF